MAGPGSNPSGSLRKLLLACRADYMSDPVSASHDQIREANWLGHVRPKLVDLHEIVVTRRVNVRRKATNDGCVLRYAAMPGLTEFGANLEPGLMVDTIVSRLGYGSGVPGFNKHFRSCLGPEIEALAAEVARLADPSLDKPKTLVKAAAMRSSFIKDCAEKFSYEAKRALKTMTLDELHRLLDEQAVREVVES